MIRASITAYSTAVGPSSETKNRRTRVSIWFMASSSPSDEVKTRLGPVREPVLSRIPAKNSPRRRAAWRSPRGEMVANALGQPRPSATPGHDDQDVPIAAGRLRSRRLNLRRHAVKRGAGVGADRLNGGQAHDD